MKKLYQLKNEDLIPLNAIGQIPLYYTLHQYNNQWRFVREIYSALDHGLKRQGDFRKIKSGYLKRITAQ